MAHVGGNLRKGEALPVARHPVLCRVSRGHVARLPYMDTPQQQAALHDLVEGGPTRRYLNALARIGTEVAAAELAEVDPSTMLRRERADESFAAAVREAKQLFTSRLAGRGVQALLNATDEQILYHPNLYFHEMQFREPARKQPELVINQGTTNVLVLPPEAAGAVAAALGLTAPAREEVGLTIDVTPDQ